MRQGVRRAIAQTPSPTYGLGQLLPDYISHVKNVLLPFWFREWNFMHTLVRTWLASYDYHCRFFASQLKRTKD